ncbi:MAG: hypothetical protein J5742_01145 [Alphaproteobacteria bacterium]|nr:hypothetical protein [Alphaproteobacteria bacterium]
MKDKIKNLFGFIGRAWRGGIRGKIGVFFALFATFMFVRIFYGDVNVGRFIANIWHLSAEQTELKQEEQKLETMQRHIHLLQSYSPDYVEELGLRYLNIGDPAFKVLKL